MQRIINLFKWFNKLLLAGVIILLITLAIFLNKPSLFINDIENITSDIINQNLNSSFKIKISSIDGNFVSGFYVKNTKVFLNSEIISSIDSVYINPNISDLFLLNISFSNISFINPEIYRFNYNQIDLTNSSTSNLDINLGRSLPFNIIIDKFSIDNGHYHSEENSYQFEGEFKSDYRDALNVLFKSFHIASDNKKLLEINAGKISVSEKNFFLNFPELIILENLGSFTIGYDLHQNKCSYSEINFKKIDLGKYGIFDDVIFTTFEAIPPIFNIENSFMYNSDKFISVMELNIGKLKSGYIDAHINSSDESDAQYDVNVNINVGSKIEIDIATNHFNYDSLLVDDFEVSCQLKNSNNSICNVHSMIFDYSNSLTMDQLTGMIEISDDAYILKNISFRSNIANGMVHYGNFSTQLSALNCDLNVIDIAQITNHFPSLPAIKGEPFNVKIDHLVKQGSTFSKIVLHADKLNWNNFLINGCDAKFEKNNNNIKYKADFYHPLFSEIKFDSLFIEGKGDKNNFINVIEGYNNSTGETIESEFTILNDTTLNIAYLNGRLKDVPFGATKMTFNKINGMITSSPLTIDFGQGSLYAQIKYLDLENYLLNFRASQIDIVELKKIFQFEDRINGEINGELYISFDNGIPTLLTNLNFRNGNFDDILFENLDIQASLRDHRLTLSQVNINTDIGQLNFNGWLTATGIENIFSEGDLLHLNGEFDKFEISYLMRYFPWEQKTNGLLSGKIYIDGIALSPRIELKSQIENPSFDMIVAKSISGHLIYKNDRLFFKGINLLTEAGEYTGTGSIPANLNFIKMVDQNIMEQPLDFIFTGKSNSFEFLVPYIDQIESLNGEFTMQLGLSGTLQNPIRGGQISIQDAKLETLQLDNEIQSLSGIATIANNKLVIKKLTGKLIKTELDKDLVTNVLNITKKIFGYSSRRESDNNISVNGTLDLSDFFNPNYTVSIDGNDIYMSSTYGQFTGEGDAEIFITGKDTLLVSGEFRPSPNNFKLLSFGDEFQIDMENNSKGKLIKYNIHVPFQDGILIDTDEVKMLVDGDINIISSDTDELVFSGKINIIEGSFNYNNNEFSQAEGKLILDPSKAAPYAEISTQTQLADESIDITFIGFLDNPNLILESSSQQYSQSDILRMLTFKDSDTIEDPSASSQMGELLANYMERELERNVSLYTELDEFKVNRSGSIISGLDDSNVNVYLGKRVSSNLYLNTRINLNQNDKMNEYEMAYRLNRNMSVVARIDENQYWHFNFRYKYKY